MAIIKITINYIENGFKKQKIFQIKKYDSYPRHEYHSLEVITMPEKNITDYQITYDHFNIIRKEDLNMFLYIPDDKVFKHRKTSPFFFADQRKRECINIILEDINGEQFNINGNYNICSVNPPIPNGLIYLGI